MKKNMLIIVILSVIFLGCKTKLIKTYNNYDKQRLEGEWVLDYIKDQQQNLQKFYSRGMPFIKFDVKQNIVSGNNGCNSFSGKMNVNGNRINFNEPITSTKMYCEGQGEPIFMQNLVKTELFSISKDGKILQFIKGDILLMSFIKK